jgi:hypothetical protein
MVSFFLQPSLFEEYLREINLYLGDEVDNPKSCTSFSRFLADT